jgi:hypothetical protein
VPAAQQQHWATASKAVAHLAASTQEQQTFSAWQPAATATRDALAPLLQQPEVELAAGSSICSPTALTVEQIVSRAARLEALVKSCSSSGGVAAASAKLSLLPQQEMPPLCSTQQGWTADTFMLGSSSSTAGATGDSSIAACAGGGEAAVAAADAGAKSSTGHAAEAAAAAAPAVSLSCQSSLQADLAVAFDEDARLHSLLASSRSSIYSRRSSTAGTATALEMVGCAGAAAVVEGEAHCFVSEEGATAAAGGCTVGAGAGSPMTAAASNDMYKAAEMVGEPQKAVSANQVQQQLDQVLSDAAVQLMLQEASETAPLQPAAAAVAAADLMSTVLLHEESITASLAAFEQEIAAMLSQSGAAGDSKGSPAWQQ